MKSHSKNTGMGCWLNFKLGGNLAKYKTGRLHNGLSIAGVLPAAAVIMKNHFHAAIGYNPLLFRMLSRRFQCPVTLYKNFQQCFRYMSLVIHLQFVLLQADD
jgi:hypothetical protein